MGSKLEPARMIEEALDRKAENSGTATHAHTWLRQAHIGFAPGPATPL